MIKSTEDQLFKNIFNFSSQPIIALKADPPRFTVAANNEQHKLTTSTVGKNIIGLSVFEAFDPKDDAGLNEFELLVSRMEECIDKKKHVKMPVFRYDLLTRDGKTFEEMWWQVELTPIFDNNNDVEYLISTSYDVTQEVLKQKVIIESEKREQNLQEELAATNEDLVATNEELRQSDESLQQMNEELQVTNEELIGTNQELILSEERLQKLNEQLEEKITARTSELLSTRAEAESQRDRLYRFFMQAPASICVLDGPDMVFELVNPLYQQLFPDRKLLGKSLAEALPEIIGQPIWDIIQNVYNTGKSFEGNQLLVPLPRYKNGPLEDRYFNFIYQARKNVQDQIDGILVFAYEVTEIMEVKQQLKGSEENFRLLADNIPQLAWMADETGSIFWYNQRWYNYTGTTFEEMKGWGWKSVHHPDHLERVVNKVSQHFESGEIWEDTFPLKSAEGEYQWFLSRAIPLRDNTGKVLSWFGTNTDITEQRQLEQQKDDFISIASHELKTPVTSLKASLQLLNKMKEDPTARMLPYLIEQANKSTERVSILIEDLLNASKLNQGQLHLNKTHFTISKLIDDCCLHIRALGAYNIITSGDMELQIIADFERVDQVIINMVNNAIKYAPDSKEIIIHIEKADDMARVSVTDRGPGISSQKLPHLFDRYFRVDSSGSQYSGLGLGLYISSEIIKKHGGDIGVNSETGKGSTFWFTLPADD